MEEKKENPFFVYLIYIKENFKHKKLAFKKEFLSFIFSFSFSSSRLDFSLSFERASELASAFCGGDGGLVMQSNLSSLKYIEWVINYYNLHSSLFFLFYPTYIPSRRFKSSLKYKNFSFFFSYFFILYYMRN